jgi:hypothetical protein
MEEDDRLEKLSYAWERLAVDLKGLWKVRFKQIYKETGRHWEQYSFSIYLCKLSDSSQNGT